MKEWTLLDDLAQEMDCTYLSDLRFLSRRDRRKLVKIITDKYPAEVVSLFEWNDALYYLTGSSPEDSPAAARDKLLKKELGVVIDWSLVDKEEYLPAMECSSVNDVEIKGLLKSALTDRVNDSEVFMKGIDASDRYEGYGGYKTEDLGIGTSHWDSEDVLKLYEAVADEAYSEYIEGGCKSRPIGELWKECGLDDTEN